MEPPFKPVNENGEGVNSDYFNIERDNLQESVVPKTNIKLINANKRAFDEFTVRK